jgi:fructokinase
LIVCLGEPLVDLFALPAGAELADAESFRPFAGGAPLNVALALGWMGLPVRFAGAVGSDGHGDRLLAEMAAAGVDARTVMRTPKKTGLCFIASGPDGRRRFLGYADSGAEYALRWDELHDPLAGARWLVCGSGSLTHEPMATSAWRALDDAAARGLSVLVDLNVRAHLWSSRDAMIAAVTKMASRATVLTGSEDDLATLGLEPTLDGMAALAPAPVRAVTHAERGAELFAAGRRHEQPAEAVELVDATGAGDAFTAGLLAAIVGSGVASLDEVPWAEVLFAACRAGARAVTAVGCTAAFRG